MARGAVPRQPAKSGKQAGVQTIRGRSVRLQSIKTPGKKAAALRPPKNLHPTDLRAGPESAVPRGYKPITPERVQAILKHLDALYPEAVCALHHTTAWELLVATILSAQSTDATVNRVTPGLFAKVSHGAGCSRRSNPNN